MSLKHSDEELEEIAREIVRGRYIPLTLRDLNKESMFAPLRQALSKLGEKVSEVDLALGDRERAYRVSPSEVLYFGGVIIHKDEIDVLKEKVRRLRTENV